MRTRSLEAAVAFYLQSRRRLGFALKAEGALLKNLVQYARQIRHRGPLTVSLALAWAQLPATAHSRQRARRLTAVRHFSLFWQTFDPRTQIPPSGLFGSPYGTRKPVHIYTTQQLTDLLQTASALPASQSPSLLNTLLGLLACTGIRISEALKLQLQDWEPRQATLTIRQSKFGRSRCVPLSVSAAKRLNAHVLGRHRTFPKSKHQALFLNPLGKPLAYEQARTTFATLRTKLGWDAQKPRPRLHDLRHTFAVNCLLGWYRNGQQELNAKILSLAVYLGHRNIRYTYWYLSAVPELLSLGTGRWAKALATQKGATHA